MTSAIEAPRFEERSLENRVSDEVDFSISTPSSVGALNKIRSILLKIIIFPYGIYCLLKFSIQRLIMLPLFPLQNYFFKGAFDRNANNIFTRNLTELKEEKFIVREVILQKNGVKYSGLLIGHENTIGNGKWVLQSTGNCEPIEHSCLDYAKIYHRRDANVLMINGPGACKSEGWADADTMGDAQEVGISFLETAIKAKEIVLAGRSLGGAAISSAILKHNFKRECRYTVLRQMTFDRISNICSEIAGCRSLVEFLVKWTDLEIDSVEASKKLQRENIYEVIVQSAKNRDFTFDGVIPKKASLGYALAKENVTENKKFLAINDPNGVRHNDFRSIEISAEEI
ncbi:MAG: hypothetical protein WCT85_03950 [Parachlamydiales bacterium]